MGREAEKRGPRPRRRVRVYRFVYRWSGQFDLQKPQRNPNRYEINASNHPALGRCLFPPTETADRTTIRFHIEPLIPEGITGWSVLVHNAGGELIRTFTGDGYLVPDMVTWDGRDENGNIREGSFTARLEMEYEKGNLGVDISRKPVLLDCLSALDNRGRGSPSLFSGRRRL